MTSKSTWDGLGTPPLINALRDICFAYTRIHQQPFASPPLKCTECVKVHWGLLCLTLIHTNCGEQHLCTPPLWQPLILKNPSCALTGAPAYSTRDTCGPPQTSEVQQALAIAYMYLGQEIEQCYTKAARQPRKASKICQDSASGSEGSAPGKECKAHCIRLLHQALKAVYLEESAKHIASGFCTILSWLHA
eukprot:scaffold301414_cov22-Tisochrysis_lutea.AAC.1